MVAWICAACDPSPRVGEVRGPSVACAWRFQVLEHLKKGLGPDLTNACIGVEIQARCRASLGQHPRRPPPPTPAFLSRSLGSQTAPLAPPCPVPVPASLPRQLRAAAPVSN